MYPSSRQGNNLNNNLNPGLNTGLRAPTGYKQNKMINTLSYNANLNLSERPVTQHGMLGMKTMNSGPKRKILSRSYFLVLLKKKIEELTNEVAKFRYEKEQKENDKQNQEQLVKKNESLISEVKELEGTLTDYNMAFDKQRAGIKPGDILSVYQHLNFQNQKFRSEIDLIFIERKNFEDKIISIQQQIMELKNFAQIKINELSTSDREEFQKLELTVKEVEQSNKLRMKKLEELNKYLVEQETKLRMDATRNKVVNLKESIEINKEKQEKLEKQLKDQSLSFEDLRKQLMEEVKEAKKNIQNLEKRVKESKKLSKMTFKKLQKMDDLLNGNEINDNQKQKYEILYQKEQEIQNNLKNNKTKIEQRITQIEDLEQKNLILLQKVSKNQHAIAKAPDRKDLQDMNNEYNYKKEQAQNSEQTLARVQQELIRRQQDLKKVDEIEETLPLRIKELETLFVTLKEQIEYYQNKDEEKDKLNNQIEKLNSKILIINENKDNIEKEYKEAENDYRRKLKNLQTHPLFKKFIENEKELSQINQLKFSLSNYIKTKENEMNYQSAIKTLETLTEIINENLCLKKKNNQIQINYFKKEFFDKKKNLFIFTSFGLCFYQFLFSYNCLQFTLNEFLSMLEEQLFHLDLEFISQSNFRDHPY